MPWLCSGLAHDPVTVIARVQKSFSEKTSEKTESLGRGAYIQNKGNQR